MKRTKLRPRPAVVAAAAVVATSAGTGAGLRAVPADETFSLDDYERVEKIDLHVHLRSEDPRFVQLAAADRFRFLTIVVHSPDEEELAARHRAAFAQRRANPGRVAVASAFPMAGWDDPGWVGKTVAHLDRTFEQGAVAVKVWKNVGMEFRDREGELVMVDDPQLKPVFDHLERRGIRLIGHLGEPKNCWLPLEEMTVKNDRSYFARNPRYHMFKHPEMPSYEAQLAARDRMVAAHPGLTFVGAHLASLEWSVDELARFLDRFPNALVDTAARMGQLQHQSNAGRAKVRDFLIRYQDRVLYGTDFGVSPGTSPEIALERARRRWHADWKYFCTAEVQEVPELDVPVPGLALPRVVVEKIYAANARRIFPQAWQNN